MNGLGGCVGLCRLALRRGLPPVLLVLFLALAGMLVAREPLRAAEALPLGPERLAAAERALARHATLALLGGLALTWTSACAALAGARWRAGELEWLAPRAASRAGVVVATWLGTWLAGCALIAGAVVAAELAAGGGPPTLTPLAELGGPRVLLLPGASEARWEVELPARTAVSVSRLSGSRVRARIAPTYGGGRAADVRFVLARATHTGGGEPNGVSEEVTARIAAPTALLLPLPTGTGPLVATLERRGGTAALVLERGGLRLLSPSPSERLGSLSAALTLALAAGALAGLSMGLASWMRPGIALLLVSALLLALYVHGGALGWSADLGLGRALELVREGLVPRAPLGGAVLGAALTVALGLALTAAGRASGERGA